MSNDIRETSIGHIAGEEIASFCSSEKKWINLIYRLKDKYPDEVRISYVNSDGSVVAEIPASWMKIKPKKRVEMSSEQIAASKARLERGRLARLRKIGDDAIAAKNEDSG